MEPWYQRLMRRLAVLVIFSFVFATPGVLVPHKTFAATRTWDGGGGTNDWSEDANWSDDTEPVAGDTVVFDGTSTKDSVVDATFGGSITVVTMNSGYLGTLSLARSLTVSSTFTQADGFFSGGSQTMTTTGAFTLSGGQFTATSGNWTHNGNWTHTAGGTFLHNNGTVIYNTSALRTYNFNSTETFYNFTHDATSATSGVLVSASDTLIVSNALTLTNGEVSASTGGSFRADGTLSIAAGFDGGAGSVDLNADIDLAPATGAVYPGLTFTNAGSSYTGPVGGSVTFEGAVAITAGTFSAGTGTSTFQHNFSVGASGTFTESTSTVVFSGTVLRTIDVNVTETFHNFTLNKTAVSTGISNADTDRFVVNGLLALTDGNLNGGIYEQRGTVSFGSAMDGGAGQVELYTLQTITLTNAQQLPGITLTVSGSTLTGAGASTTNFIDGDLILESGTTFNAGAGTVTIGDDISLTGATFNHDSGTIVLADGASVDHAFTGNITFNNLTLFGCCSGESITLPAGGTTGIQGVLDVSPDDGEPVANISLRSSSLGVAANIDMDGSYVIHNLAVQDITNTGSVTPINCVVRCTDSGNNTGWSFGAKGVIIGRISGNTTESGGTATFTVRLAGSPTNSVSMALSSSDVTEGTISPSSLTFTTGNWNSDQTVTLTGADDADNDGGVNYTAVTGALTSADTAFNGINPRDIAVYTTDNDTPAGAIDFDVSADFTEENIAPALGITAFYHGTRGNGAVYNFDSDLYVDITGTRVRAGCTITIDADNPLGDGEYTITKVWEDSVDGEITIAPDPATASTDPRIFDDINRTGLVTAITCAETSAFGGRLHSDFISVDSVVADFGSNSMIYDAEYNTLWSDAGDIGRIPLDTRVVNYVDRGTGSERALAIDPTRDRIWGLNSSDDTIVALDTATGAYDFSGTEVASTFAVCDGPEGITYDSEQDRLWVLCGASSAIDALSEVNPETGALIGTLNLEASASGTFSSRGVVYDSTNNVVWAAIASGEKLVAVDATTRTPKFGGGSLSASTFQLPANDTTFNNIHTLIYDAGTDTVWVHAADCAADYDDYATKVRASTGEVLGQFPTTRCGAGLVADPARDSIFFTGGSSSAVTELRVADGSEVERHFTMNESYNVALDSEGDIWSSENNLYAHEYVRDGVAEDEFYTLVTTDNGQLDTSASTSLSSATVTQSLDSGNIYYAVSFDDRHNFKVRTAGVWRIIASDQNAVHGGTDGNWYYRNDADGWTAVTGNTAPEAVSFAMENGAVNNRTLDATALAALDSSAWGGAGGFSASVDTLDVATTFYTTDPHNAPSVQNITFSLSSAPTTGSSAPPVWPSNISFDLDGGAACPVDANVHLILTATNASQVLISNDDPEFATAVWELFVPSAEAETANTMMKSWTLSSGEGEHTVYVRLRSSTGNTSSTFTESIALFPSACDEPVAPPALPTDTPPAETPDEPTEIPVGAGEDAEGAQPGFIRTPGDSTVYSRIDDGTLRPFTDLQTYLTYADSCGEVSYVEQDSIDGLTVGSPMLPKPGSVLVQFPDDVRIFAIEAQPTDADKVLLRWIQDESVAQANFGQYWSDYIINIPVPDPSSFVFGNPVVSNEMTGDAYALRSRAALNGDVSYDLYIINPDGTRRYAFSNYARIKYPGDGTIIHGFEDKGVDFDFNDVIFRVDPRSCLTLGVSMYPLDAGWHHQIGIEVHYEGKLRDDFILWSDSHEAVGQAKLIDLTNVNELRNVTTSTTVQLERTQSPIGEITKNFFTAIANFISWF